MSHWHDDEHGCTCDDFDPATVTVALPLQPNVRRYRLVPIAEPSDADRANSGRVPAQEAACRWAHGPVAELDSRGLCPVCAEDDDVTEDGAR